MLKVYFTASTTNNGEFLPYYQEIIDCLKKNSIKIISGEQIIDKLKLSKDAELKKQAIFEREKKLIDEADFVVAEVTKPSHGVGGEIVYALIKKVPVLALSQAQNEDKISPMLVGNPSDNFFLETYTTSKLPYIIKNFVSHINVLKNRKGKLIVIDGGDGSGKTTQAKLLLENFKIKNIKAKYVDFPQYYETFHGKIVARFLRGEFGKINEVSPYLASLAYAIDRASIKQEMDDFLKQGGFIIANRYATSSMAHQAAKFLNKKEREEFIKWEYELEYKVHKIPKEDLVIYLYVPWKFGMELTAKKTGEKFLKGKKDITNDTNHRINSEKMYLELAKKYKHWVVIECIKDNQLLSKEIIHQKIVEILKERFKI